MTLLTAVLSPIVFIGFEKALYGLVPDAMISFDVLLLCCGDVTLLEGCCISTA